MIIVRRVLLVGTHAGSLGAGYDKPPRRERVPTLGVLIRALRRKPFPGSVKRGTGVAFPGAQSRASLRLFCAQSSTVFPLPPQHPAFQKASSTKTRQNVVNIFNYHNRHSFY